MAAPYLPFISYKMLKFATIQFGCFSFFVSFTIFVDISVSIIHMNAKEKPKKNSNINTINGSIEVHSLRFSIKSH